MHTFFIAIMTFILQATCKMKVILQQYPPPEQCRISNLEKPTSLQHALSHRAQPWPHR
jgi:hypothetical protein